MRVDLLSLAETENEDPELVPEILPVDARLAVRGSVSIFQNLFERAASVTPIKEIITGTGHALLEAFAAEPGVSAYVRVSATDGTLTTQMYADGIEVLMPGAVLVPGKKISDILKSAPTATVQMEILGNTATIRSGRAMWEVQTPVGDALPPAPDVANVQTHRLSAASLQKALGVARKAASNSPARMTLMQLLVASGSITGLDGGRMHRQAVPGLPDTVDLTIPLAVADEMVRMLRGAKDDEVLFGGNSSHLVLRVDEDVLIAQRLLLDFPSVESQVLNPTLTNVHSMTLSRTDLEDAVKRVRINADPDYQAIFLTLAPGKATKDGKTWSLIVSAQDRLKNTAQESLEVQWVGPSKPRALCVNHRTFMDLLSFLDDEFVTLKIGEDSKAVILPVLVDNQPAGFLGWVQQIRAGYMK